MTNHALAARARQLAGRAELGSLDRDSALIACLALRESRTVGGARRIPRNWAAGPDDIKTAALNLLDQFDQLTTTERTAP